MDAERFDRLARLFAVGGSRRHFVKGAVTAAVAWAGGGLGRVEAKSRCHSGGQSCSKDGHCCSNVCAPADQRGKRHCLCNRPGDVQCGGACVQSLSDVNNCGVCGHVCPGSPCGPSICTNGLCGIASDPAANGLPCTPADLCFETGLCSNGTCVGDLAFICVPECTACNPANGLCEPALEGNACLTGPDPDNGTCSGGECKSAEGGACTGDADCVEGQCVEFGQYGGHACCATGVVTDLGGCCGSATEACSFSCCEAPESCVNSDIGFTYCCPEGTVEACHGACCPVACIHGKCCPSELVTIRTDECCPVGSTDACSFDCCTEGESCVDSDIGFTYCCPAGTVIACKGDCCPVDCINGRCCPSGVVTADDTCCPAGTTEGCSFDCCTSPNRCIISDIGFSYCCPPDTVANCHGACCSVACVNGACPT